MQQPDRKPEPYGLVEYQSREPRVFGVELRAFPRGGVQDALGALHWLGRSRPFQDELTFLVMHLPGEAGAREITRLAECARQEGMLGKLCFVVSARAHRLARTIAALQRNGLTVLLGDVGKASRFSDLTDWPLGGVVIDSDLVAQACGDPHAACILDAIIGLTNGLGLKSFVSGCPTRSEFDFALSAGVSYVAGGQLPADSLGVALTAVARASATSRSKWAATHPGRSS